MLRYAFSKHDSRIRGGRASSTEVGLAGPQEKQVRRVRGLGAVSKELEGTHKLDHYKAQNKAAWEVF